MDYFIQPIFNCCLINIGDMLDNGTVMNGKLIESPKSFQVACTVMTQIISAVASSQYGGQSVDTRHLGKYLRKSADKYRKHYTERYAGKIAPDVIEEFVKERVNDELRSGVQTIQYQINTLMTTNGQSPFVTLFLNLDPKDEYIKENAMIIEEILRQRLEGIKNEKGVYVTPAFPKLIYVLDEHNALKGGEYDYITKLAVRCSAKRMYPDYISAKKMRENYEGNVFSPMGCRSFLPPWKDENGNYKPLNPEYKNFGEARVNSTTCRGSMIVQNEYYDTVCGYTFDAVKLLEMQKENGKDDIMEEYDTIQRVLKTKEEIQSLAQIKPTISDIVDRYITTWVTGGVDDASWDSYKTELEGAGLNELVKTYQGAVDRAASAAN